MPVLMVSLKTSPHPGFSRNRSMRPSSPVITMPNSSGSSTRFGWLLVRGRSLVPCPPAITTAFMEGNDTGRPVPASGRARGSTRSPTLGRSDRRSHVEPVDDRGQVVGGDPAPEDDPAHGQRAPVEPQPEPSPGDQWDGYHQREGGHLPDPADV